MVAGERRRPAASSTAGTIMGSPPNRTAGHRAAALPALAHPASRVTLGDRALAFHGDAEAAGSSTTRPTLVPSRHVPRQRARRPHPVLKRESGVSRLTPLGFSR